MTEQDEQKLIDLEQQRNGAMAAFGAAYNDAMRMVDALGLQPADTLSRVLERIEELKTERGEDDGPTRGKLTAELAFAVEKNKRTEAMVAAVANAIVDISKTRKGEAGPWNDAIDGAIDILVASLRTAADDFGKRTEVSTSAALELLARAGARLEPSGLRDEIAALLDWPEQQENDADGEAKTT